jgi:hypothetical protein
MAYDKKSSGCTPITAKIKKTTQGGMVTQPLLNMGAPVKMKMSSPTKQTKKVGKPKAPKKAAEADSKTKKRLSSDKYASPAKNAANRAKANEARIKARAAAGAAKEGAQKALELKKAKELASKEFITNKRGRKVKNPAYQTQTIQPVKETSGNKTGSTKANRELKDILERKGIDVSSYKGDPRGKMEKGTYRYAKASQPGLDGIISKRNKAMKGTAEYNRYQNQINKAYGVGPTNRSTTESTTSTIKPKVSIETKKPTASTDVSALKPKASKITNKKAAKKTVNKTARAARVRQKGIDALASGNSAKALRLKRREARINKRAEKQAAKAIEPKKDKKPKRAAKGSRAATLRK